MNIIVTGASGFVGENLLKYLFSNGILSDTISLRDVNWENKINNSASVIIHLAGKAHDTSNVSNPEEYFKINRDLTIQLFNRFLKSDIRDFFFLSSVKAVADTVEGVLTENFTACPTTPYGQSKLEAEEYLLNQELPRGKRLFVIRPCMIHGPGNKGNLNLLYKVVEKGVPWPLASFENKRSFLSIDNLCYLLLEILRNESVQSGIYNFSDDDSLSTNELVTLISETLEKKPRLLSIPANFVKSIVKLGDILPLPLNSERLKKLTESYIVSNDKIKKALGIKFLPLKASEGLEMTIRSFKKSNK